MVLFRSEERLWCYRAGPPATFVQYSSVDELPLRRKVKAEMSAESEAFEGSRLRPATCRFLMKVRSHQLRVVFS